MGRISIVNMAILPNAIYTFNDDPNENHHLILYRNIYLKNYLKIYVKPQDASYSQNNNEQTEKCDGNTISNLKIYYRAIVIKTA